MGGYGSGRPGSGHPKAEQMLRLDIVRLERRGNLRGFPTRLSWSWGNDDEAGSIIVRAVAAGLWLTYRTRTGEDEWRDIEELVPFIWTPMKFGGQRRWFQCLSCRRKCRILYGGRRFRCRGCHRVRYSSQSETKADRANRAMFKIVKRLKPRRAVQRPTLEAEGHALAHIQPARGAL
jgi:hypothetical protein